MIESFPKGYSMKIILKGPRITLMHLEPSMDNAKLMHEVLLKNKKHLLPWMSWAKTLENTPKSIKDRYNFLIQSDKDWENDKAYEYVTVLDDKIIGGCSAASVDIPNKKAELACWLAKDYRRYGYAMESVNLLEQELFKNGFNKIIIRNDVLNKDSVNVAIKAGYELEGVLKADKWLKDEHRFRDVNCFAKFKKK